MPLKAFKPPMDTDADARDHLLATWHARCEHVPDRSGTAISGPVPQICRTHRAALPCPYAESLMPLIREVREDERWRLMSKGESPIDDD